MVGRHLPGQDSEEYGRAIALLHVDNSAWSSHLSRLPLRGETPQARAVLYEEQPPQNDAPNSPSTAKKHHVVPSKVANRGHNHRLLCSERQKTYHDPS